MQIPIPPHLQKPAALVAVVLIAGGLFLWFRPRHRPPVFVPDHARGLGMVAAQETARLLGKPDRVVVWTYREGTKFQNLMETTLSSLRDELGKAGSTVDQVERLEAPPGLGEIPDVEQTAISVEQLRALLAKAGSAGAIVAMVPLPSLGADEIAQLPTPRPKIVVITLLGGSSPSLLTDGLVNVALVQRRDVSSDTTTPKSPQEWFDRYYKVITPATAQ